MKPLLLDGGVVVGFCDPDNPIHTTVRNTLVQALGAGRRLVMPASSLCELLATAFQATPHAARTIESLVDDLIDQVHNIDRLTSRAAALYLARYPQLTLADALLLGTAKVLGADEILTTQPALATFDSRAHVLN